MRGMCVHGYSLKEYCYPCAKQKEHKMNKAAKIVRYLAKYPHAKPDEVAKATGSTKSSVYTIKYRHKDQIAAKRREIMEENNDNVLDLSDYSIIKTHIPEEDLKEFAYQASQGAGRIAPEPQSVEALLDERGAVYGGYGKFKDLAEVAQRFKDSLQYFLITRNKYLAPDQQEALDMIFHKVARIINGDADYVDNWKDIAGYAMLISDRLEGNAR